MPAPTLTALVSGGKDSIYAAYLAATQGWPIQELLVLAPSDPDSWMFHTPNLGLVDLQARALGVPVRRVSVAAGDESTELETLARALGEGGRGAVSVGAIASSYQWTRVLRVADRVGRRIYAPLWRVDPVRVVREEIAAGLDIRFVRVAAEGLGEEWLGRRLDGPALEALATLGVRGPKVHPAGEGGEFETAVLDAPFFRERIDIERAHVERRGAAWTWTVDAAHLAPKAPPATPN